MMMHTILKLLLVTLLISACQPVVLEPPEADLQLLEQGIAVDTDQVADEMLLEQERVILLEANSVLVYRYVEEMWNLADMDIANEILAEGFVDYSPELGRAPDEHSDKSRLMADAASFHASGKRYQLDNLIVTENSIVLRIMVLHPENGEDLRAVEEDIILLVLKDGQITERYVMRSGWE